MKKLLTALLVGLSAMAVSTPAMAHSGDIAPDPLWNFNFGATPGTDGTSYVGQGEVWSSLNVADGSDNYWNYFAGNPVPDGTFILSGTQVFRATSYTANKGNLVMSAPIAYTVDADLLGGYIQSNASADITMTMTVPNFGSDSGHIYVYTESGQQTSELHGVTSAGGTSTTYLNKMYYWTETMGTVDTSDDVYYDVYEYFVWSTNPGGIELTAYSTDASGTRITGTINAMQLTPIPPHGLIPEPGTAALLAVGGLVGTFIRRRKASAEA